MLFDNINSMVVDDLKVSIKIGSKLSIASACFSIYAFQELKEQLATNQMQTSKDTTRKII